MGKPKKGSKKKADDDWVDEVLKEVEPLKAPEETKKKKPKQTAKTSQFMALEIEEPDEEPDEEVVDHKPKHDPKKKDKKKNGFDALEIEDEMVDEGEDDNEKVAERKPKDDSKKKKKDKKKNVIDALEIEDEMVDEGEEDNEMVAERKPKDDSKKKKKDKKKNVFDALEIEDEMVDEGEEDNEKVAERKPKDDSKKKKKDKKKNGFDALEIEDEIVDEGEEDNEKVAERKPKDDSKKKKKDKKKNINDATENEDEMLCIKEESNKDGDKSKETKIVDDQEDNITSTNKSKREKRKKKKFDIDDLEDFDAEEPEVPKIEQKLKLKQKPEDSKDTPENEAGNDDDEDGPLIKTAAQKRAEKKEREKKKREIEKQKAKKAAKGVEDVLQPDQEKKEQTEDMQTKPEVLQEKESSATPTANEPKEISTETQEKAQQENNEPAGEENEQEEETEDKQKKKRKRKKKAGEEEEKKVRKPNKALVKQMQQQLEQLRLEEERRKKEEEERIRALEEAENRRLEKIRHEKEMKERKKQLEKERIARLKQEGKYLTKAQKEQRAKQMAMLEALKEQGITVPALTKEGQEHLRKHVRYGSRKPRNKQQQQQQQQKQEQNQQEREPTAKETELPEVKEENKEKEVDAKSVTPESAKEEEEEVEEDVKDSWDVDSEEEDETDKGDEKVEMAETVETAEMAEEVEKQIPEQSKEEESEESTSEESDEESDEESESESDDDKVDKTETVAERILRRKNRAELKRSTDKLRSPVICVLGHVDTGKTKILDKIRHTHVQDGEAGGITQQIGATMVPESAIKIQTAMIKDFENFNIQIPGLLIIDTPGHESFSNLRSRGSSLCDMAILVVDIMHGLEPQTIESINLLKAKKTPFVVALNKVDRLFEWKRGPDSSIINTIKKQKRNTKQEFEERVKIVIKEFAEQSLNACLFYENKDTRTYVSLIPTSAHTGDGMGDLISQVVRLTQTRMTQKLTYSEYLDGIVLEVKALPGLGTTIDVILVNGKLKEGDTLILPGIEGPIVTQIRALLTPQPLKELRVKNQYLSHKELCGAQGVKISAKELEKALAGVPIMVAENDDEIEYCKNEVSAILSAALKAIKLSDRGVYVQASTLGSLEALLEFLKTSKIPYAGVNIGPVHKKDVMKCSTMLEHEVQYAVILAFDVKIEREATELADHLGVKIFSAEIIYHLFDKFTEYREEQKRKRRDEFKTIAVFPCKLRILAQHIYNSRDPIVLGVTVEAGIVKEGTPLCVPSKSFVDIGVVTGIEANHKAITEARKGMEVCLKIENIPGETPKLYGRHFDHEDLLISKISRESIDAVKEYFREDLQKSDWQLMIELKKIFQIV